MKKVCECCGKEFIAFLSWDTKCYKCEKLEHLKKIQDSINEAEPDEKVDTFSTDYVVCPYCGNGMETDLGYEDFPEIYEEGDHEIECPECENTFILNTSVSYSWETEKLKSEENHNA